MWREHVRNCRQLRFRSNDSQQAIRKRDAALKYSWRCALYWRDWCEDLLQNGRHDLIWSPCLSARNERRQLTAWERITNKRRDTWWAGPSQRTHVRRESQCVEGGVRTSWANEELTMRCRRTDSGSSVDEGTSKSRDLPRSRCPACCHWTTLKASETTARCVRNKQKYTKTLKDEISECPPHTHNWDCLRETTTSWFSWRQVTRTCTRYPLILSLNKIMYCQIFS